MKALIQRVQQASVTIDGECCGSIEKGLLVLLGVEREDDQDKADKLLKKLLKYRVFSDTEGKMNLSLTDTQGGLLVVSQFTLVANTSSGLRPSFSRGAPPEQGKQLYDYFVSQAEQLHPTVATGQFAADMQVSLINDGPVTFLLES